MFVTYQQFHAFVQLPNDAWRPLQFSLLRRDLEKQTHKTFHDLPTTKMDAQKNILMYTFLYNYISGQLFIVLGVLHVYHILFQWLFEKCFQGC